MTDVAPPSGGGRHDARGKGVGPSYEQSKSCSGQLPSFKKGGLSGGAVAFDKSDVLVSDALLQLFDGSGATIAIQFTPSSSNGQQQYMFNYGNGYRGTNKYSFALRGKCITALSHILSIQSELVLPVSPLQFRLPHDGQELHVSMDSSELCNRDRNLEMGVDAGARGGATRFGIHGGASLFSPDAIDTPRPLLNRVQNIVEAGVRGMERKSCA